MNHQHLGHDTKFSKFNMFVGVDFGAHKTRCTVIQTNSTVGITTDIVDVTTGCCDSTVRVNTGINDNPQNYVTIPINKRFLFNSYHQPNKEIQCCSSNGATIKPLESLTPINIFIHQLQHIQNELKKNKINIDKCYFTVTVPIMVPILKLQQLNDARMYLAIHCIMN